MSVSHDIGREGRPAAETLALRPEPVAVRGRRNLTVVTRTRFVADADLTAELKTAE